MTLIQRILGLAAISILGIALLAPLAARSAVEAPVEADDRLLEIAAIAPGEAAEAALLGDRGGLTVRDAPNASALNADGEALEAAPVPTPGSAAMEATLYVEATPAPTPAPVAARPAAPPSTYSGDSVWDDLAKCESGGNWSINTGNGYYGGLQFNYGTWHAYGGGEFAEYPHQATREEQITVAERLRADRGYAPWPACRAKLGLP